jgi:hypothetical protein
LRWLKIDEQSYILFSISMDRKEQPPHPITLEAAEYLRSLTPAQMELHEIATKLLGSSYFVERTKGFLEWKNRLKN